MCNPGFTLEHRLCSYPLQVKILSLLLLTMGKVFNLFVLFFHL